MARSHGVLPGGSRVTDHISLGVLAKYFPRAEVDKVLAESGKQSQRQRHLPAHVMVYYTMALGLHMQVSCEEVLRLLVLAFKWLLGSDEQVPVASPSAISRARERLGKAPVRLLHDRLVKPVAKRATKGAFYGRWKLVSLDGSTMEVPDSRANAGHFGKPDGSGQNRSYPQLRFVSLVENGTHILMASHLGPYTTSEIVLGAEVIKALDKHMLCLADRLFYSYQLWQQAVETGAQLVWRVKKNLTLPCLKVLEDGSYLSQLPAHRGSQDKKILVRVVEYTLNGLEDAEPLYRVITTIVDPRQATAAELAALYHERWEIENALDELKTHLRGAKLRLRSLLPELVEQEFYGLMMTHYAVRALMHEAALHSGRDPDELSYVHAVNVIRHWLPLIVASPPPAPQGTTQSRNRRTAQQARRVKSRSPQPTHSQADQDPLPTPTRPAEED